MRLPISGGRELRWLLLSWRDCRLERFPILEGRLVKRFPAKYNDCNSWRFQNPVNNERIWFASACRIWSLDIFAIVSGRVVSWLLFIQRDFNPVRLPISVGREVRLLYLRSRLYNRVRFSREPGIEVMKLCPNAISTTDKRLPRDVGRSPERLLLDKLRECTLVFPDISV